MVRRRRRDVEVQLSHHPGDQQCSVARDRGGRMRAYAAFATSDRQAFTLELLSRRLVSVETLAKHLKQHQMMRLQDEALDR